MNEIRRAGLARHIRAACRINRERVVLIDTASRTVVDVEAAIKRMQPVGIQRENSPRPFADAEL